MLRGGGTISHDALTLNDAACPRTIDDFPDATQELNGRIPLVPDPDPVGINELLLGRYTVRTLVHTLGAYADFLGNETNHRLR